MLTIDKDYIELKDQRINRTSDISPSQWFDLWQPVNEPMPTKSRFYLMNIEERIADINMSIEYLARNTKVERHQLEDIREQIDGWLDTLPQGNDHESTEDVG